MRRPGRCRRHACLLAYYSRCATKAGLWLLAFMLVAILEEFCGKFSILKQALNHTPGYAVGVAIYQFA